MKIISCFTMIYLTMLILQLLNSNSDYDLTYETKNNFPKSSQELGEKLFNDPILSKDMKVSCASCHKPELAFADSINFSEGFNKNKTMRNTPSILYMSKRPYYFWDGRAKSLEEQALMPIVHPKEMNLSLQKATKRLKSNKFYKMAFVKIYNNLPTTYLLSYSLASFQRTLESYDSKFDKFLKGDLNAMSKSAVRGLDLYLSGNCKKCHGFQEDFSLDVLANIGLDNKNGDLGLFTLSKDSADIYKFKTPGLRNIAVTAPYMHDGSVYSLREVIEFYNTPSRFNNKLKLDARMKNQFKMTSENIDDIIEFLKCLTDAKYEVLINQK